MIRHFINKSKKILAGAMAVFMMASSALSPQAYTETPKEETIQYRMGTEADESLYGTRTWNFVNDGTEGCYDNTTAFTGTMDFNGMNIDASKGKISKGYNASNGSPRSDMQPGVELTVPVVGEYTVSIKAYFCDGAGFRIDEQTQSVEEALDGVLSIDGTADSEKDITIVTYGQGIHVETITITCKKSITADELYKSREWNFVNDGTEGCYDNSTVFTGVMDFNGMTIDASKGKVSKGYNASSGSPRSDMQPGVELTLPVVGSYIVSIKAYFCSGAGFKIGEKTQSVENALDGILSINGTANGVENITISTYGQGIHVETITVTCTKGYDPISSYVENRKIDVWDFGGVEEADTEKYTNYIQKSFYESLDPSLFKERGTFKSAGQYDFGDLTWIHHDSDRIYYNNANNSASGTNSADIKKDKYKYDFGDGYTSLGAYYAAGVGSSDGMGSRCVEIKNVLPGDVITAYMMVENADMKLHFLYEGSEGEQDDIVPLVTDVYTKTTFTAEYAGTYKLYLNNGEGKPRFLRITRTPGVLVKGNIDLGSNSITDYQVILEDKTSGKRISAKVYPDGTFAALVPANTTLTAILAGAKGYGFTDQSKGITTTNTVLENIELIVEAKDLSVLSGSISGFADDFNISNLKMVLSCTNPSLLKEDVALEVAADRTYLAELENDVEYRLTMTGANDYELTEDIVIKLTGNTTKDISVKKKEVYPVSGQFLGLNETDRVEEIVFVHLEERDRYAGTVTENGYTGNLRTGEYEIIAPVAGYTMVGHIVVDQSSTKKDLLYLSTAKEKLDLVSDLYVGYPADMLEEGALNYNTVKEAVKACAAMNPSSEAERITVHIYPGIYREQVIIETPYLTFVNDYPEQEVLLTWYYGVGYQYYSANKDGYYDENLAFDKYSQNSVNKWGASVYIKSKATDFRAENIIFETSFNRYLTQEEIEDGAQPDMKEAIRVQREEGLDVTTKTATERACALAVDADRAEFKNCTILGSQDTLFIQLNTHTYFNECLISGNTDYIFGDGDAVFDHCELQWYGYSDQPAGGYITAVQNQAPKGCLFLDCTVTSNRDLQVGKGCFGRPWREGAHVVFLNTILESEDMIQAAGWSDMSDGKAENSYFREFNTTLLDGTPVDTSGRVKDTVISAEEAKKIHAKDYFAGWQPYYYVEKEPEIDPDTVVSEVEKFEDLTITIPKEGINKQEIMAKVPTSAAVICISGKETEATVVWDDSELEEIYTEATEFVLTGTLVEFEDTTVTVKVILVLSEEPEDPTQPSEPEDPTQPSEPEDPTQPSEPEDPTQPNEPEDPTQPSEPEDPTQPSEPEDPTQPSKPEDPTQPSEPEDPTQPSEPEDPTQPSEPEDPTQPSEPEDPTQPSEPEDPTQPSEPEDPTQPSEPEDPTQPTEPSYEDDEDDSDDSEDIDLNLTYSEQSSVEDIFGSSAEIQDVVESDTGKLVISVSKEIVFCEKDGTLSKDKWQKVEGSWYYFGSNSKAVSGWLKTKDKWYFMDQTDKKMETGWLKTADGKWYLLDSVNGDMKTGWQQRGGKWYLLDSVNGDMKTGWQQRNGKWYLLDGINGDMKTGWQQTADGKWYYMNSAGEMAANTITPDGYRVGPTGAWIR